MNKNDRALLLGMLIGDGCLKTKTHTKDDGSISKYYEYVLCHSTKQEAYLDYKLDLFHSIMGGKRPNKSYHCGKLGDSVRFSRAHKLFRILHRYLYSRGNKKYLTERVLNYLTPQAIAIWYMDDGGLKPSLNKFGVPTSCQTQLSTYCSEEQADIIIEYFKTRWGITWRKNLHKKTQLYYLTLNTTEGKKFCDLVKPYIIPSMEYKLLSKRIARVPDTLTEASVGDDIV